ncbi:DUF1552 domain-containing protein [Haliangium sp.]|uniref:DUF1552 domain-containing protein n=1 Tax=Haliangium sp. TaxID=2663208 RepID=UPI003D12048A
MSRHRPSRPLSRPRMPSRRRFLRGLAGAAVAAPLLPSLAPRRLWAQAQEPPPRRLVCIYTPNGQHVDQWLPSGGETDFTLSPVLAPLAPFRDRLLILHGMRGSYGHEQGHSECLTGWPSNGDSFASPAGPSLDQLLAEDTGRATPLRSLELGVNTRSTASSVISYSSAGLGIPAVTSAGGAFDRVIAAGNVDPEAAERRRRRDQSVLDAVIDDYQQLQAQLGPEERRLLDAHLTLVREQEARLAEPIEASSCDVAAPVGGDLGPADSFAATCRHHIDTIAAAFTCDVSRVATLVLGRSGASTHYTWAGVNDDFHEIAHGNVAGAYDKFLAIQRWHAEQVAYLLERLAAIPEDGGSVLDNTAVLWTGELGLHRFTHLRDSVPIVLAGGAGGGLRGGRLLDLSGAHYHDLLLTLAHIMGRTDLTSFGERGTTVLSTLS